MNHKDIIEVHDRIDRERPETLIEACNLFLGYLDAPERVKTPQQAYTGLYGAFQGYLDSDQYAEAALLIWGDKLFDPRARSAKMVWSAMTASSKVLIIGGAGTGKTWPVSARIVLEWVEDPENTAFKIISTTAGHAKSNIMAKIFRFHRESALRLPGYIKNNSIELGKGDKSASISQVAIPEGDMGQGRLTGFHPMPRKLHPKFGLKTRVGAYIDEADTVPYGLWEGLDNMLATEDSSGTRSVRVVGLTNPRDKSNSFASRAEPNGGFNSVDPDVDEGWISRDGWQVVRLDPAKSENVTQRREVYPGMMTYEGFQNYVRKGKGSPDYWIMGRGWYPEQTAEFVVVSSYLFESAMGVYSFTGEVTPAASLDPAFAEGGDDPMMTTCRTGTAVAFTTAKGERIVFPEPIKNAIQMEQQFAIQKSNDPAVMGRQVIDICNSLQVRPEWFVMDRTGNALGLYGWINAQFGTVMGMEWGGAASDLKILQEDTKTAYERYSGINTEMYFAFGLWMQYSQIKFAPIFANFQRVQSEVSNRRYYFHRSLQKLEDKVSFKARNEGNSPDAGDSAVMLAHLIRIRSSQNPAMIAESDRRIKTGTTLDNFKESITARPKFYDT